MDKKINEKHLKCEYGISLLEYENILDAQNTRCKICNVIFNSYPETTTKPCIDHNHKTKKIRGIICTLCNTGIGMFRDSADNLEKAAVYIRAEGSRND